MARPTENPKLSNEITPLIEALAFAEDSVKRRMLVARIVNRCVSVAALETDEECRAYIRGMIREILRHPDADGQPVLPTGYQKLIMRRIGTKLTAVYRVSDALYGEPPPQLKQMKSESKHEASWTPDFMKSLTEPLNLDKQ